MSKNHSRRDILKMLGAGALVAASPMELFLDHLVSGLIQKAVAGEAKELCSKYILIQQYAAPPRWMFDLFLSPYSDASKSVMVNKSVASEFTASGGRYTDATYKTHKVKGVNAPVIWTHDVGTGSGGKRPISDLMDNMIVLQGIDALNPGHQPAAGLMNRPLTPYSLDGILADKANLPFGGIGLGAVYLDFKSEQGKSSQVYTSGQDFAKLLPAAFASGVGDLHTKYSTEIDRAVEKLNRGIASTKLGGKSLGVDQKAARKLMLGEIDKISKDYPGLLKKYEKIIKKTISLSENLKGLTDKPIGKVEVTEVKAVAETLTSPPVKGVKGVSREDDLKYKIRDGRGFIKDPDIRSTVKTATFSNLAKQFAVAEYVITNNLTASTSLNISTLRAKLKINDTTTRNESLTNDQHSTGIIASVLYATIYYRVSSACMLGLINGLKATPYKGSNMFDHTVIRCSGEFGRHPRTDGTGSDHSPWSSNCMILSGKIKGLTIAGQILRNGADGKRRAGSWGLAGRLKHGPTATTGHVISSIATMLDIPSPSTNNPSLIIKNDNDEWIINPGYIDKTEVV